MKRKLKSKRGESLIEVLGSVLVIALGLTILAEAVYVGTNAQRRMEDVVINQIDPSSPRAENDKLTVTISRPSGASVQYLRDSTQVGRLYYYD